MKTLNLKSFRGLYVYAESLDKPCEVKSALFGIYPDNLDENLQEAIFGHENDHQFYYWFTESEFKNIQIGSLIDDNGTWLVDMTELQPYDIDVVDVYEEEMK